LSNILTPDQRRALGNVRAAAERIWKAPLHRYYTDHTVAHSERVIALLDGLTAGMMGTDQRLVPSEAFILLAAAYLHDVGMQDERFADGDLEAIRAAHHEVTAEWIYRTLEAPETVVDLGLPDDPGLVEAVALVSKAHRRVDLGASDYDPFPHGGETVRPRLLAALLRFGDELDIDHRRVDLALLKLMAPPVESQLHWWKCHYVSGVNIVNEYIRIAYRFPRPRPDYEDLLIPLVEKEVRRKLASLEEIFRTHSVKLALGKPQVRLMRSVRQLPPEIERIAGEEARSSEAIVEQEVRDQGSVESELILPHGDLEDLRLMLVMLQEKLHSEYRSRQSPDDWRSPKICYEWGNVERGKLFRIALMNLESDEPCGQVTAIRRPDGQILLRVWHYDTDLGRRLWQRLYEEIDQSGFTGPDSSSNEGSAESHRTTVFDQRGQQVDQQTNVAGDYVDQRPGGSQYHVQIVGDGNVVGDGSSSHVVKGSAPSAGADTGGWNTGAIRDLLSAAFSDGELTTLCFDYFHPVYENFGTGMGKGQKIQLLLGHCVRQQNLGKLVQRVKERNPAQYSRFAGRLRS
jgi:hypothetical protein